MLGAVRIALVCASAISRNRSRAVVQLPLARLPTCRFHPVTGIDASSASAHVRHRRWPPCRCGVHRRGGDRPRCRRARLDDLPDPRVFHRGRDAGRAQDQRRAPQGHPQRPRRRRVHLRRVAGGPLRRGPDGERHPRAGPGVLLAAACGRCGSAATTPTDRPGHRRGGRVLARRAVAGAAVHRARRGSPYRRGELTHDGCPLAWPVSGHEFHLLPHRLRITTGRFAEHWIISTLLLAGLGYLLWRDTGVAAIVHHLDTMERTGA